MRSGEGAVARPLFILLCLVGVLAPLVFVPGGLDAANLPQSAFIQLSALVLALVWLLGGHAGRRYSLPRSPLKLPALSLFVWSAVSLLWARNRYEGALVLGHWAACAAIGLLVAAEVREEGDVRWLLRSIFAGGVAVAVLGVLQYLLAVTWVPQAFPPAATFVNKNVAAQFVVMVIPLGVALLLEASSRTEAATVAVGNGLLCLYLFDTRTRSAWLGFLAVGMVWLVGWMRAGSWRQPAWRRAMMWGLGALVVLVIAHAMRSKGGEGIAGAYERLASAWQTAFSEGPEHAGAAKAPQSVASVRGRLAMWRNALAMVRDSPIAGVGLGNAAIVYPLYARRAVVDPLFNTRQQLDYVHNEYLQLAVELGLVGFALVVWLAAAMVKVASGAARGALALALPSVPIALAASLVGIGVDAFFSFPFRRAVPPLLVMIALGLLAAFSRSGEPAPSEERIAEPPHWLGRLLLGATGVGLAALVWIQIGWIRGDRHCRRMLDAEARGDQATAIAEAEAARGLSPHRPEPLFTLGNAYLSAGDPRRAVEVLEPLVASYPYDSNALANLGLAYSGKGDVGRALEFCRRAAALQPQEALLQYRLGAALAATGSRAEAVAAYRLAAQAEPGSAFYQYHLGIAALQSGAVPEAKEALEKTLALDPRSAGAHKALGVLLLQGGRRDEAVEHMRSALSLGPGIADAAQMRQVVGAYDAEHRKR